MFSKILIANRGEIALRIQRTCREMGIHDVCVYSEADRDAKYVRLAHETICIGPADPTQSYLNPASLIAAAEVSEAEAIHPGYGFLSENADFAEQVEASGFVFIGPKIETLRIMGDKIQAKRTMRSAGLRLIPGFDIDAEGDAKDLVKHSKQIGFPLMIKASAGGGGRGMRIIHTEAMLRNSIGMLARESKRSFGDGVLYAEKLLSGARHIEVQIMADTHGNVLHLGTRDCSVQRRHQKLIEEAPAPNITPKATERLCQHAVDACKKVGYEGAGTMEFLYDGKNFYFIEMNSRLQVEHPVTEMITGYDLVEMQLRAAAGEKLPMKQRDIVLNGHAIECRINAEDSVTYAPSPGTVTAYHPAGGPGIRVDSHIYLDSVISHHYDSLIGKVIAHGIDREQALARMRRSLSEFVIGGVKNNIPMHQRIISNAAFQQGAVSVDFLESMQ